MPTRAEDPAPHAAPCKAHASISLALHTMEQQQHEPGMQGTSCSTSLNKSAGCMPQHTRSLSPCPFMVPHFAGTNTSALNPELSTHQNSSTGTPLISRNITLLPAERWQERFMLLLLIPNDASPAALCCLMSRCPPWVGASGTSTATSAHTAG